MAAPRPRTGKASAAIPQLDWTRARPAGVVLISGPEDVLAERAARLLRDQLAQADPGLEVSDLAADDYAPGELLTLASPSLFGEPRLVRVTRVEKCSDAFLSDMLAYLPTPADGACVQLRHHGGVRGKKLLDAVRAAENTAIEIVCAELKRDADKEAFAAAEFRTAGKQIAPPALHALVQAFAGDLAELAAACAQLIADTSDTVTEATVDRYYGGRVETNAFRVADAAIAGHYASALITLRHALDSGADPVPLVAAFASKVRTMARLYGARGPSAQLAREHGLAPWQVDRARRDLQGWSGPGLARAVQALAEADAAVKGAGRDPVFALERMIGVVSARGER